MSCTELYSLHSCRSVNVGFLSPQAVSKHTSHVTMRVIRCGRLVPALCDITEVNSTRTEVNNTRVPDVQKTEQTTKISIQLGSSAQLFSNLKEPHCLLSVLGAVEKKSSFVYFLI